MKHERSIRDFSQARKIMPGGVNSPVRAFKNVGRNPAFYDHAFGSRVWDVDGNEYIDFICSWGPLILGHANEEVVAAVQAQAARGMSYGAPCEAEILLAQKICDLVPGVEQIRMVSSGTEATMTAIRLARGFTRRDAIIKFEGCYHGHCDSLLVAAGSGAATFGIPDTAGVTAAMAADTMVARYNDLDSVRVLLESKPVACIIVEPVAGNMGVVPPQTGFLEGLRELCDEFGALLVFDEVITGFRMGLGGAQEAFGITADLCTFGKIVGGGMPVGCIAGPERIMGHLSPNGPVYQAGTLSGNPIAMEAGLAQLQQLERLEADCSLYAQLERKGTMLADGLRQAAANAGVTACVNQIGSVATLFFTEGPVIDWNSANTSDPSAFSEYFSHMFDAGILIAPSQFEALFVSAAHDDDDINRFVSSARDALEALQGQ